MEDFHHQAFAYCLAGLHDPPSSVSLVICRLLFLGLFSATVGYFDISLEVHKPCRWVAASYCRGGCVHAVLISATGAGLLARVITGLCFALVGLHGFAYSSVTARHIQFVSHPDVRE